MSNAFIFHGTEGYPEENWFPWLKQKLETLDCKTIVPYFPTPENQTLKNWFEVFEKYKNLYTPETILIGHSLGGTFLLRVLEKYNIKIKGAYLVSAPIGVMPIKNYNGDKLFIGDPFDWKKIRNSAEKFTVFHSDNDPYVCLGNGEKLAKKLKTDLTFIPNAGHFNKAAGFLEFKELYQRISSDK